MFWFMTVFSGRESSTPQCSALALEPSKPLFIVKTRLPTPDTTTADESKPQPSLGFSTSHFLRTECRLRLWSIHLQLAKTSLADTDTPCSGDPARCPVRKVGHSSRLPCFSPLALGPGYPALTTSAQVQPTTSTSKRVRAALKKVKTSKFHCPRGLVRSQTLVDSNLQPLPAYTRTCLLPQKGALSLRLPWQSLGFYSSSLELRPQFLRN